MGVNQTIYVELRKRFIAACAPPPTEYPNEDFAKPTASMWARFDVLTFENAETQLEIGGGPKYFRIDGQLVIQLFVPQNTGEIDILVKADTIADSFRNWSGIYVTCKESSVKKVGNDPYGWYQVNIVTPFKCDTQH